MKISKLVPALAGAAIIALTLPGVSLADADTAKAKAAQHAGLAAGSGDIAMVKRHLHHTLNCLVGADGDGFDESAGNPCAPDGGAIPQTANGEMKMKLEGIAAEVRDGVMGDDLASVQALAGSVQEMLAD